MFITTIANKVLSAIDGKKTFIAAIIAILYGITSNHPQIIIEGLLALGFRDAINKIQTAN